MPLPSQILDKLRQAKFERRLVAYHKWGDDPTIFLVGFVEELKSDRIHFDQVGTQGEPENEVDIVDMDMIQWLDFDTDYLRGLEMLYPVYNEVVGKMPGAGIKVTRRPAIESNLAAVKGTGEVVLLELQDQKKDCFVHDTADDFVCYTELRDGGRPDGVSWMKVELIRVLKRKSDRQLADQFLFEHRKD